MLKKTIRFLFSLLTIFVFYNEFLIIEHPEKKSIKMDEFLTNDIDVSMEEINFEEISFDIANNQLTSKPDYEYTSETKTVYATEEINVYNLPDKNTQEIVFSISKRDSLNVIGYNSYNKTYKINHNNNIYYVDTENLIDDINLIFDNCSGERYINQINVDIKDYPSDTAKTVTTLDINNIVELLEVNNNNYYRIKIEDTEGYVHKDYLSEEKINYITPMQQKVADLAYKSLTKNQGTYPARAGYCAAWVSGLYEAAGIKRPAAHAIDYWTKWKESGSTDMTNIPIGAAVVASGSDNPTGGMIYGHVGIYIGDTNGDGEGEVIDNIGYIAHWELSDWISWQKTPVYHHSSGKKYGPGFIGWVWPHNEPLGEGV